MPYQALTPMSASSKSQNNLVSFVNQASLRDLIRELPIMIFSISAERAITSWNKECELITGYSSQDVVENAAASQALFVDTDTIPGFLAGWDNPTQLNPYRHWEGEIIGKDGSRKYISLSYRIRKDFVVAGFHIWCIGLDITDKVVHQKTLKVSEERLSLAAKAAKMGFWDWNKTNNEVFYSLECFQLLGYRWMEFKPSYEKWLEITHPEDRSRIQNHILECYNNQKSEFAVEFRCKAKKGHYAWLFTQAIVFDRDANGKATRMVGIVFDISARKRTEQDLKEALVTVEELKKALEEENLQLKQELQGSFRFEDIISISETYKKVLRQVEQVAPTDATVLVLGETGTGKSLIANNIHRMSQRAGKPLIKVNCAALPENLIESELFGHEKGAFTGAYARKAGRFELADKGSIFLDEVGELPLELQAKLLRVLQDGEFEPLGSYHTRKVDVRIIAATNRNLELLVQQGLFRADLYYRLNVFPIHNPPLRERKEDIPLLVKYFVNKYNAKTNKHITTIPKKTLQLLENYDWPGNIRELENTIERAIVLSVGSKLEMDDWFPTNRIETTEASDTTSAGFDTLEEHERKHILQALKQTEGRVTGPKGAGKLLGINDKTLQSRMRKLGISRYREFK